MSDQFFKNIKASLDAAGELPKQETESDLLYEKVKASVNKKAGNYDAKAGDDELLAANCEWCTEDYQIYDGHNGRCKKCKNKKGKAPFGVEASLSKQAGEYDEHGYSISDEDPSPSSHVEAIWKREDGKTYLIYADTVQYDPYMFEVEKIREIIDPMKMRVGENLGPELELTDELKELAESTMEDGETDIIFDH